MLQRELMAVDSGSRQAWSKGDGLYARDAGGGRNVGGNRFLQQSVQGVGWG
jgi:hypothetical protein